MNMTKARVSGITIAVFACALFGWISIHHTLNTKADAQQIPSASELPDPDTIVPHYSYDGLTLAPAPRVPSEDSDMLQSLLNAQILKFTVNVTKPNLMVTYILEVRKKGYPTKIISQFSVEPFTNKTTPYLSNIFVGFLPLNGDLVNADKIRYEINNDGCASWTVIDNPFKGWATFGTANFDPSQKDIPLLSSYMSNGTGSVERTLYLRLQTKAGK